MEFKDVDFLSDPSLVDDPHPYYRFLRRYPVQRVGPHGVVAVTGWEEAAAVWLDVDTFSSCNAFGGPFPGLPVEPDGDDISDLIEQHRHVYPISEHMVTFDPPLHTMHRALLMRSVWLADRRSSEAWTSLPGRR